VPEVRMQAFSRSLHAAYVRGQAHPQKGVPEVRQAVHDPRNRTQPLTQPAAPAVERGPCRDSGPCGLLHMTRYAVVLLLIGSVMLGTGCTSISTRATKPDGITPRYLYPGVECDIDVITWPFVEQDHRCVTGILLWPIGGSLCVIDLPFSFVVDTVCLPYDGVMMTYGGRNRMGEKKNTVNEPDVGDRK